MALAVVLPRVFWGVFSSPSNPSKHNDCQRQCSRVKSFTPCGHHSYHSECNGALRGEELSWPLGKTFFGVNCFCPGANACKLLCFSYRDLESYDLEFLPQSAQGMSTFAISTPRGSTDLSVKSQCPTDCVHNNFSKHTPKELCNGCVLGCLHFHSHSMRYSMRSLTQPFTILHKGCFIYI